MIAAAAGFNWTAVGVLAACVTAAIAVLVALNGEVKDRQAKREGERTVEKGQYEELREAVDHLTVAMVGKPADASRGIPAVDGFVQRQEAHNQRVDDELSTANGGGTLKGTVVQLRTSVQRLTAAVRAAGIKIDGDAA